jgi:hypothetical protein
MSSSWPDTSDSAGIGGDPDVEHDQHDDMSGDRLPESARRALVSLLMNRYISKARHRATWEGVLSYENDLRARLDEMYLDLVVDQEAEVAFKRSRKAKTSPVSCAVRRP